jgi:hypothetical protein
MKKMTTSFHRQRAGILAALFVGGLPALVGCGKSGPERVPVFPVEGTVTLEGKPMPGAIIVLHPKSGARSDVPAPRAQIKSDGSFRFTTYDADDGAPPGDYVATIAWYRLVGQGGDVQAGPNVLPPKYSNPKLSKWEIRIANEPTRLPAVRLRR